MSRCLEGWRSLIRAFPLEWRTCLHPWMCFGPGLQLEWNWSEVQARNDAQVGTRLQRQLSLKGRAEVCAMYIFPLILYRLSVLPLPRNHQLVLQQSLFKLLWGDWRPMVHRRVCCQVMGSRYAWSGEPQVRWKTGLLGLILVKEHSVEEKGERSLLWP